MVRECRTDVFTRGDLQVHYGSSVSLEQVVVLATRLMGGAKASLVQL